MGVDLTLTAEADDAERMWRLHLASTLGGRC